MSLRARIRDGDEAAFEALFDEMAQPVYSHALWLTGSWSTAEDVVSLTFLEAWRLRHRIDADGGSLRPWVLGIATNRSEEHTSELQSRENLVCRLLLEKKKA